MNIDTLRARLSILDRLAVLEEIEFALDHLMLWSLMNNGRYWLMRRNGATKRWARDPGSFRIPIKAGLKYMSAITNHDLVGFAPLPFGYYVISETNPGLTKV